MSKAEEASSTARLRAALTRNAMLDGPQAMTIEDLAGLHVSAFPATAEIRPVVGDDEPRTMGVLTRVGARFSYRIRHYISRRTWRGVLGLDWHVQLLKLELDNRERAMGDVSDASLSIDSAGALLEATVALRATVADEAVREMEVVDAGLKRGAALVAAAAEGAARDLLPRVS